MSACGAGKVAVPCAHDESGDRVYVVGQGWHAEFGLPVEELTGSLSYFRQAFPSARFVMFGYGKRTFFVAPARSFTEYVLAPVPGPAVIHAVALSVSPLEAYPLGTTLMLKLPEGGAKALAQHLADDLVQNEKGEPIAIQRSQNPDGMFYAAQSRYSLEHTCNTWTAEALSAGGLPIHGQGVIYSDDAMRRVQATAAQQCHQ